MNTSQLENYFNNAKLPKVIELEPGVKIYNIRDFIDTHISVLNHRKKDNSYKAFYDRLIKLKEAIEAINEK